MTQAREFCFLLLFGIMIAFSTAQATAQQQLEGQVLGAGAPIAKATVTLWAASADAPVQLAQTESDTDGHFALSIAGAPSWR